MSESRTLIISIATYFATLPISNSEISMFSDDKFYNRWDVTHNFAVFFFIYFEKWLVSWRSFSLILRYLIWVSLIDGYVGWPTLIELREPHSDSYIRIDFRSVRRRMRSAQSCILMLLMCDPASTRESCFPYTQVNRITRVYCGNCRMRTNLVQTGEKKKRKKKREANLLFVPLSSLDLAFIS